jgi:hypothetical protein
MFISFFPVGYMTGFLMPIPVGFGFLTGIPVGLADSVKRIAGETRAVRIPDSQSSGVNRFPCRDVPDGGFLRAARQEYIS